jgi:hypothetical protein
LAGPDATLLQQSSEPPGQPGKLRVSGDTAAVALIADHGDLAVEAAEIVEQCSQMIAHWIPAT